MLLKNGADINETYGTYGILHYVALKGNVDIVKAFDSERSQTNVQNRMDCCTDCATLRSLEGGCVDIVKVLLQNGANANAGSSYKNTHRS